MTTTPSTQAPGGTGAVAPFPGTESLDPSSVFSGPGYSPPPVRSDPVCVAALVAAVLSPTPLVGLVAAGLGFWGLRRLRSSWATGESMAWTGVVVGLASTVAWAWVWVLIYL